tara:strand:- start:1151 stop:1489 length:339 start_codon:yes stop_codon:yes gene_type:complete
MRTVDHIALHVDNLDVAQKWYEEKLDAICEYSDSFYRRMRFNNTTVALISKHRYPYPHVGILTKCKEDLPQDGERVEHRDGTIGVYTFDPDGNCIEHIWYNEECEKMIRHED